MMQIRQAQFQDRDRVRAVYLAAFSEAEREEVAGLAVDLLSENTSPETFALVAETDHELVGHVSFSPVNRTHTDDLVGYILAPLAVRPESQQQGIGAGLIETGMERLSYLQVDMVFVYGDPRYYGRFGFDAGIAAGYSPPYKLQYPFGWQAKALADPQHLPSSVGLTCVHSLMNPQLW